MNESLENLERVFAVARSRAAVFVAEHNAPLPKNCPGCHDSGHVPGLRCPACGYRHRIPWAIIRDTEWGYEVVALTNRRTVFCVFNVDPD